MNLTDAIATTKFQLETIEAREKANQQEQAAIDRRVKQLEMEIQEKYTRQSQLDEEAIQLYSQAEALRQKISKLERIAQLTQEFKDLQSECSQDRSLLDALYTSVAMTQTEKIAEREDKGQSDKIDRPSESSNDFQLTIERIKQALPNAEKLYQQLVTKYLEIFQSYQNFLVDGLDLIWCALAFIAFGRASYRQMCLKFHPDRQGSERSMQLINSAWEIARKYLEERENASKVTT